MMWSACPNYAGRTASYDETTSVPASLTLTLNGASEIVFDKFSGDPTPASLNWQLESSDNEDRVITLNAKGMGDHYDPL